MYEVIVLVILAIAFVSFTLRIYSGHIAIYCYLNRDRVDREISEKSFTSFRSSMIILNEIVITFILLLLLSSNLLGVNSHDLFRYIFEMMFVITNILVFIVFLFIKNRIPVEDMSSIDINRTGVDVVFKSPDNNKKFNPLEYYSNIFIVLTIIAFALLFIVLMLH